MKPLTALILLYAFVMNDSAAEVNIIPSSKTTVAEFSSFTVSCFTDANILSLSWYKNRIEVTTVSPQTGGACGFFGAVIDTSIYSCRCYVGNFTWTILNVTRDMNGEAWQCKITTSLGNILSSANLTLYIPVQVTTVTLKHENSEPGDDEIVEVTAGTPASFTCIPGESRPPPTIVWYVGTSQRQLSSNTDFLLTAVNSDHDEKIFCKAYNLQNRSEAVESSAAKLYVRMQVTTVTLKHGNSLPGEEDIVKVTAGTPDSFTCIPGTSRPTPTIVWYIGTLQQQSSNSTSFLLTAVNSDHDKKIFCKAYNIQNPSEAVESSAAKLYVRVQVTTVTLEHGNKPLGDDENVEVTAGAPVSFTCKPGDSRPPPTIVWYVGTSERLSSSNTNFLLTANNSDHDEKIFCTAYNLQDKDDAVVSVKANLYVRVQVTNVTLKQGNNLPGDDEIVVVTAGTPVSFACLPGESRPSPTIVWYVGTSQRQSSSSTNFLLTASNANHNMKIFCKAYNIQDETKAVVSSKAKLYVRVQVTNVTLKQGDRHLGEDEIIKVTAGTPVLLTCLPGAGRPLPTIDWYVGESQRQSSNNTNFLLIANNSDHFMRIFCKAYNIQDETKAVVSSKAKLYVRVIAETPQIIVSSDEALLEYDIYSFQCQSTPTRPASIIAWKIGSMDLKESTSSNETDQKGLIKVISTVELNVSRSYHETKIFCTSTIIDQSNTPETSKNIIVFWSPDRPKIEPGNKDFPWQEAETGKLNCTTLEPGNPPSTVRWIKNYERSDTQNPLIIRNLSYRDNGHLVKCCLKNSYTTVKNLTIESEEIKLDVQYAPKILTTATTFAGKPYENITIPIKFLVNPNVTTIEIRINDKPVSNSSKYSLSIGETSIKSADHGIETDYTVAYQLDFTIFDLLLEDFTVYDLHLTNIVNTTVKSCNVTSESRPLLPVAFKLLEQRGSYLVFYWEKGFNGGHIQTFWLQVTETGTDNWRNKTIVDESDRRVDLPTGAYIANITDLNPGIYSVRLISVNVIGKAQPVMLGSDINIAPAEKKPETFPVAAVAGVGVGAAAVVIMVIILMLIWKRRRTPKLTEDEGKKTILTPKRQPNARDNDDLAEINLNPMYESSETVQLPPTSADVYAKVEKRSYPFSRGASSDVYSVVSKTEKKDPKSEPKDGKVSDVYSTPTKKEKGKDKKKKIDERKKKLKTSKQVDGSVNENAETTSSKLKGGDNIYENPVCSTIDEKPCQSKKDDGLIYIEVDFPQQKDAQIKEPVIHGEDRTIYADVAYGQVGEPRPESDEEEK